MDEPGLCEAPECDRHAYALGYCQTHYRQFRTTGKVKPIRLYRERAPGTVKLVGLRVPRPIAEEIWRRAREEGLAVSAVVSSILESWSEDRRRRARR
ncbi:MAG TPA: hypothetical protein VK447_17370 [Myxococcaceae bacterium]|nr:hypothetical protein [Myxococcaceae bacterium]